MKRSLFIPFFVVAGFLCFSQEALKSTEDEYYDFLSLNGAVKRTYFNYRTLSDNKYTINEEGPQLSDFPWTEENLGKTRSLWSKNLLPSNYFTDGINTSLDCKAYGPELFISHNSQAPFGQNDGALWQGRGWNTSFTGGFRLEAFGFEATFKPQITWSQNTDFEIMKSAGKNEYGYFWGGGHVDYPQRFGDSSFKTYDWGDTEIRWTWRKITAGFGTQSVWTGPVWENPVLLSNNSPSFPKFDFGLRRSSVYLPYFNWYLGDLEARYFIGKLSESDYFDNDSSNDHNMLTGISLSYQLPFKAFQGLNIGLTKFTMSKWGEQTSKYLDPTFSTNTLRNHTGEDSKAALTADWLLTDSGFEVYGELGFDDFTPNGFIFYEYARWPFHAVSYAVGFKKSLTFSAEKKIYGVLNFEWNNSEASQDYQMWPGSGYNWMFHGQISQGWTNKGQLLGSGYGYGGNSQLLSLKVYSKHGFGRFLIGRNNPDNSFIWNKSVDTSAKKSVWYFASYKANFYAGVESMWFVTPQFSVNAGYLYNLIINPQYELTGDTFEEQYSIKNHRVTFGLKYQL